jgi:hypothetical protein
MTAIDCARNLVHARGCIALLEDGATPDQIADAEAVIWPSVERGQLEIPLSIAA